MMVDFKSSKTVGAKIVGEELVYGNEVLNGVCHFNIVWSHQAEGTHIFYNAQIKA
jgi:hypothetical protein